MWVQFEYSNTYSAASDVGSISSTSLKNYRKYVSSEIRNSVSVAWLTFMFCVHILLVPPYGKETAPGIQTIFDIEHLNAAAFFLNTQCKSGVQQTLSWWILTLSPQDRMPQPVGQFISQHIYRSKLRSKHDIEDMSCVQFVDVFKGEETKVESSWMVRLHVRGRFSNSINVPCFRIWKKCTLSSILCDTTTSPRISASSHLMIHREAPFKGL